LVGIPPAPRGVPQIEVAFDIDANGIVHVSAKDLGTGKEQSIRITAPHKLDKDEIEKMVKQAEQFAQADKTRKELAEAKNQADQLIYTTEKSLKDLSDKVRSDDRQAIEEAIKVLRDALKTENAEKIRQGTDALIQASHKLAEEVYKKAQPSQGAGAQPGAGSASGEHEQSAGSSSGADDKVVDAEFKVEDDKR
jgi:molecular chaperone DnaK